MSLYDKRDDFPFSIHNYPHRDGNVPCMPTYGVYISQMTRFAKSCNTYTDFLRRHQNLVRTLTKYTLNSEPKALTGDKSEGIKSQGAAEAFIRGFIPS